MRSGETLGSIAQSYRVSIASLAAANELTSNSTLKIGEQLSVPEPGVVIVGTGDSLWTVAKAHGVGAEALAKANGITLSTLLQPGTRLRLPGVAKTKEAPASKGGVELKSKIVKNEPAPVGMKSGTVAFHRVATGEKLKLTITDNKGRVRPQAAKRMAAFLRPRGSKKQKRPDLRLLALITEVSKHYDGRTIQVMSGYRVAKGFTSKESRHTKGAAMDIKIDGVTNRQLCDYLRHFKNVGVGFYPHSLFVHFDVRDKSAYWIDMSSPGGKPSYLDGEQRQHFDGFKKDEGLVELGRAVSDAIGDDGEYDGEPEDE
ncbi:MAG TPA: LysM peptidoglycan-binding domain-containing protein [Polyangiales bacterium]|nr:LysM peptidoglycan-binding domain-containing protein [Polyangiales bacterium]